MVDVRKGSRRVGGFLHGTNNRCRRRTALLMAIDTMTGRIYNTEAGSQMNRINRFSVTFSIMEQTERVSGGYSRHDNCG